MKAKNRAVTIRWNASEKDAVTIVRITDRATNLGISNNWLQTQMDLTATHLNGCRLDLQRLLDADDNNFAHDIHGIQVHLDRTTGKLKDCFLPRHAYRSKRRG